MLRPRLSVAFLCFWISGVVVGSVGKGMGAELLRTSVQESPTMCAGEKSYVERRKLVVAKALGDLSINCTHQDLVPNVALMASGGGERSAMALLGSLYQMKEDGLLDSMLYLGGVSGGTWSMAALYSDPQWSSDMNLTLSKLTSAGVELDEVFLWLTKRSQKEFFSLSDVWGVMTSAGIMNQMNIRNFSEEATRSVTNPYPVYCAVENNCYLNGPAEGKWFEVSPHEAGFPEIGLFVETSLLGSRFHGGHLVEKRPEMDMIELQGILGSALADVETVKDTIPTWLNVSRHEDSIMEVHMHVFVALRKIVTLLQEGIKDPLTGLHLKQLQKILEDQHQDGELLKKKSEAERRQYLQLWSLQVLRECETWSNSLPEGPAKTRMTIIVGKIIPLVLRWEWGTTRNFLYQHSDPRVPECLKSMEGLNLVDAGLLINVAYPSFLGDKRDVDLMIVPENSAGDMFETLTLARDYAAQVNKTFPVIKPEMLQEREWPRDCYVLEGGDTSIVYMPLFNRNNCKNAEEVKRRMIEFATFQPPLSPEKVAFLIEVGKENMRNNKEVILREVEKAVARRQTRKGTKICDMC